jgi:hypothetical protein
MGHRDLFRPLMKVARNIDCPGSNTEVNGETMVKIYSQGRGVVRLTLWAAYSL